VPVVSVQPDRQRGSAVVRGWVGLSVGPFAQGGLDEALGFAVCLGRIRLGPDVFETEIAAGLLDQGGALHPGALRSFCQLIENALRLVGDGDRDEPSAVLLVPRAPG